MKNNIERKVDYLTIELRATDNVCHFCLIGHSNKDSFILYDIDHPLHTLLNRLNSPDVKQSRLPEYNPKDEIDEQLLER